MDLVRNSKQNKTATKEVLSTAEYSHLIGHTTFENRRTRVTRGEEEEKGSFSLFVFVQGWFVQEASRKNKKSGDNESGTEKHSCLCRTKTQAKAPTVNCIQPGAVKQRKE
jgi:hypothetical protein